MIWTLTGLGVLARALLSSNGLALAPGWLLQIFGVLVGRCGGDRAVLGSWTALPARRQRCSDRLVFSATCHVGAFVRRAGLPWAQDGRDVNPRQVWLRALTRFVFGQGAQPLRVTLLSLCVLCVMLAFAVRIRRNLVCVRRRRRRRMIGVPFVTILLHPHLF